MSDEQQFIITVDYGKYAYRYLFVTNIIPYPEWPDDDKRWLRYDERKVVAERFKEWCKKQIGWDGTNDGKIVLIEPTDLVFANGKQDGLEPKND